MKFPIVFSSPDWRAPYLSASPHTPVPSSSPWLLFCTCSVCLCLSCTREPRTGHSSPYGSHQCWLVVKLISLVLLAALVQPGISFAFFVASTYDGFIFSLVLTRTFSPFLLSCITAGWSPACTSPGSGLWTCWISWGSCEPFLQPRFLRSEWQHSALVC